METMETIISIRPIIAVLIATVASLLIMVTPKKPNSEGDLVGFRRSGYFPDRPFDDPAGPGR